MFIKLLLSRLIDFFFQYKKHCYLIVLLYFINSLVLTFKLIKQNKIKLNKVIWLLI